MGGDCLGKALEYSVFLSFLTQTEYYHSERFLLFCVFERFV